MNSMPTRFAPTFFGHHDAVARNRRRIRCRELRIEKPVPELVVLHAHLDIGTEPARSDDDALRCIDLDRVSVRIHGRHARNTCAFHDKFVGARLHEVFDRIVLVGNRLFIGLHEAEARLVVRRIMRTRPERAHVLRSVVVPVKAHFSKVLRGARRELAELINEREVGSVVTRLKGLHGVIFGRIEDTLRARLLVRLELLAHFVKQFLVKFVLWRFGDHVANDLLLRLGHLELAFEDRIRVVVAAAGAHRVAAERSCLFNHDDSRIVFRGTHCS